MQNNDFFDKNEQEQKTDFSYMDELARAYETARQAKMRQKQTRFCKEKLEFLHSEQTKLYDFADILYKKALTAELKELCLILRESAGDFIHYLEKDYQVNAQKNSVDCSAPLNKMLTEILLIINRSLTQILRHKNENHPELLNLILSEECAINAIYNTK